MADVDYKKEGKIAIFTINRPEAMNSMSVQANHELHEAMVDFRDDPELWVGIVTGAGEKAFCGGADIKDTLSFMKEHSHDAWSFPPTIMRGFELWKPLIAAVNGVALGGGLEIVLACDLRIAAEKARFGTPEVGLGLVPGWGGTQRVPRAVPWCKAAEMLLTARLIDAQEAYRVGLISDVVEPDELMNLAKNYAEKIASNAPLSVKAAKQAVLMGMEMPLDNAIPFAQLLWGVLRDTDDRKEGFAAFSEKRTPKWQGK